MSTTPFDFDALAKSNGIDPNAFHALPIGEKHKALTEIMPGYSSLPQQEQMKALGEAQYGVTPSPLHEISMEQPLGAPISPLGAAASYPRAAVGLASAYGAGKLSDLFTKNPWIHDASALLGSLVGESTVSGIVDAHPIIRGIGRDIANKYIGKTAADAILPPPPTAEAPPPDMAAEVAQQVAKEKALQTAREEAGLRRPQADVDAERAAKAQEAAYNKEGQENVAIQKRYDDAQADRMAAEKAAKNAQLKAEQAHVANLADAERARQAELTAQAKMKQIQDQMDAADAAKQADALASLKTQMAQAEKEASAAAAQTERLRTMHGDDLMRRGKEQAGLDKAARDAAAAEDSAKAELTQKRQTIDMTQAYGLGLPRPGAPTESEQLLSRLNKSGIWTPEMERDAIRMWGTKARMEPSEGIVNYRARIQGYMYPGRAPRGIPDYESEGASPSSMRGLPPPPSATAAAPAFRLETDPNGIRWAVAPDGVRISVPSRITDDALHEYATSKLADYRTMLATRSSLPAPPAAP